MAVPGLTPTPPLMKVDPVFVTVLPAPAEQMAVADCSTLAARVLQSPRPR
jgi:hypothetical protein